MAGIGFELRKLFQGQGLLPGLRACLYSTFVTVGPALLCILMLTILQQFLYDLGVAITQRELFMAAVIYSFVFSLILASGLTMVLARYISDKIYKNELEDILPSLHGAITICMVLGGLPCFVFYYHSPLDLPFKLAGYLLFMELIILWLQMVYVSALRDYRKLVKGFFAGVGTGLVLAYVLVAMLQVEPVLGMLGAMNAGFFVIITFFAASIQSYFRTSSKKYFCFLEYLDKYPALLLISFLYTLGLYIHNFVFWIGTYQVNVSGTYVIAPLYDVPAFWAFLTVMPAIVIFVVSCETSFFEKYRAYYDTVCNGGTMDDINRSKEEMRAALSQSLRQVMGMQLVITFICLLLGMHFLPLAGLSRLSINIFNVLVIGNYAFIILFILISILLYFDDRRSALMVVVVFVLTNTLGTIGSAFLGENYYGLGFMAAAFLSLALGFIRLNIFLKNIDYFTFCAQPMQQCEKEKVFTWLSRKIHTLLDDSQ